MGMFDSLIIKCKCGKDIEFQSKSGVCRLEVYNIGNMPPDVAGGLHGEVEKCSGCGTSYQVQTQVMTHVVEYKGDPDSDV